MQHYALITHTLQTALCGVVGCALLVAPVAFGSSATAVSETTISGSGSVSSEVRASASGGTSSVSVETTINGERVESHEETARGDVSYSSTVTSDDAAVSVESQAGSPVGDRIVDDTTTEATAKLQELITRLQTLIALYVTLLNSQ